MALMTISPLAQGMNTGLQSALDTYLKVRQQTKQDNVQQQQMQLTAMEHGLIPDPENPGGFLPNPSTQGKQAYDAAQFDPKHPLAEQTRGLLKDTIKQVHPNYTPEQLDAAAPPGQSSKSYSDAIGLIKPQVSGVYQVESRKQLADVGRERNQIQRDQGDKRIGLQGEGLDLRKGKAANDINKQFNMDPVVKATDMQQNSITKGEQQLNSTDKPITNQMLNEIQADYANALTGGRQAAQGTIHDQQMQTLAGKAANLKQYITGSPTQAATQDQIDYFKTAFNELKGLNKQIRQSRISTLSSGATAAYGDKGPFGKVIENQMGNASGQGLIPPQAAPQAPSNQITPDVQAYATAHGITPEAALAIKIKRGGQ